MNPLKSFSGLKDLVRLSLELEGLTSLLKDQTHLQKMRTPILYSVYIRTAGPANLLHGNNIFTTGTNIFTTGPANLLQDQTYLLQDRNKFTMGPNLFTTGLNIFTTAPWIFTLGLKILFTMGAKMF